MPTVINEPGFWLLVAIGVPWLYFMIRLALKPDAQPEDRRGIHRSGQSQDLYKDVSSSFQDQTKPNLRTTESNNSQVQPRKSTSTLTREAESPSVRVDYGWRGSLYFTSVEIDADNRDYSCASRGEAVTAWAEREARGRQDAEAKTQSLIPTEDLSKKPQSGLAGAINPSGLSTIRYVPDSTVYRCPYCGWLASLAEIRQHCKACKRSKTQSDKTMTSSVNLNRHLNEVHGQTGSEPIARQQVNNVQENNSHAPHIPATDIPNVNLQGMVTDQFYDQQYGDKYVGQSWPQSDGMYGSIPLYDDYGDEGRPD